MIVTMSRDKAKQRAKNGLSAAFIVNADRLQQESGLTNIEVAKASGISEVTVSRLMNGRYGTKSVTWETLIGLAKAFGIQSWDELFGPPSQLQTSPE